LQHGIEATQKLLWMAEKGLPVAYTPGMMTGATAPVTMAAGLVEGNAELLSGLLMAQLTREGAPFVYGGGIDPIDMQTMTMTYGSPEFMLNMCALTELGRYYRLPVFSFAGCTDSKVFDQQATLEGGIWMLISALSGGNLVHDVGYINNGLTSSYEMLVSMDEAAGMVKRIMGGVEVNEETMAVDVIDKVGPAGHFLSEDHTYRHFRENWFPSLLNRENYETWKDSGGLTLGDRASRKAREILESHRPQALPDSVQSQLSEIVRNAEARHRT
jgi:trimethylamine--corrinoid protein Co-methyltransferase